MIILRNSFLLRIGFLGYFGFGSGTNQAPVRLTNIGQQLDQSPNPDTDTHPQVMTPNVSFYTDCAPCSFQKPV